MPGLGRSKACSGKLTLKVKKKGVIAGAGFKVPAGKTRKVTLKLGNGAQRLVRRKKAAAGSRSRSPPTRARPCARS